MKIIGISGALAGWKTNVAVNRVLREATLQQSNVVTELIDIRDYDVEFVRGDPLSYYNADTWNVVKKILAADVLVVGTPIYQASMSGALKNLLDYFPVDAFKGKVTGIVTTGAIEKHFLVAEYQIKPVLTYLKGLVPTEHVFIHNDSFDEENEIIDQDVLKRMENLAKELIFLQKSLADRGD